MRTSECDILILPGLGGDTPEHWYMRWAQKLSTARRVDQQDFNHPKLGNWEQRLVEAADKTQRPIVLIGHSLGALTGALTAPRLKNVAAALLVAPPAARVLRTIPEVDPAFADAQLAKLDFPALLVASRNDPYSSYEESEQRAQSLGAVLVDAGESGHLNPESGHGPWPEGLMRFAHFMGQIKDQKTN